MNKFISANKFYFRSRSLLHSLANRCVSTGNPSGPTSPAKSSIIFILGGPGAGKGTVSSSLASEYGMKHISAGQLLREAIQSGSPHGALIDKICQEGNIVPSSITVELLQNEIQKHAPCRFLVDGFPRNMENYNSWLRSPISDPDHDTVLVLNCPRENLVDRLKLRSQVSGRSDDNMETITNRFKVFESETRPVIAAFHSHKQAVEVHAADTPERVYTAVKSALWDFLFQNELKHINIQLFQCLESCDWTGLAKLCSHDDFECCLKYQVKII